MRTLFVAFVTNTGLETGQSSPLDVCLGAFVDHRAAAARIMRNLCGDERRWYYTPDGTHWFPPLSHMPVPGNPEYPWKLVANEEVLATIECVTIERRSIAPQDRRERR